MLEILAWTVLILVFFFGGLPIVGSVVNERNAGYRKNFGMGLFIFIAVIIAMIIAWAIIHAAKVFVE